MEMKKETNIWPYILIGWILAAAAALIILGLTSCTKEPMPDSCYVITETWTADRTYVVIENDYKVDTLAYFLELNINWQVGDTICQLAEAEIKPCEP